MEQNTCRAQLARLLADETTLLGTLAGQLQREHELLEANDVEGLEQASRARQQSVAALLDLDGERRRLCRMLGQSADQAGLSAVLRWCDPQGTLADAHATCAAQAQRCREQNDRNGALVTARLNRVSNMLGMLNGNAAPKTYEARGATRPNPAATVAGRMLSISA